MSPGNARDKRTVQSLQSHCDALAHASHQRGDRQRKQLRGDHFSTSPGLPRETVGGWGAEGRAPPRGWCIDRDLGHVRCSP